MSRLARFFLLAAVLFLAAVTRNIIKGLTDSSPTRNAFIPVQAKDTTIDLLSDMEEYCVLPIEFKEGYDSVLVVHFANKIDEYPSDKRDYLCSFANLYSRFMIDMLHNEYDFIHLKAIRYSSYMESFALGDSTQKEYDSLYYYYGVKKIRDIKLSEIGNINMFVDSMKTKNNLKYLPNYLNERERSIQYGLSRKYLWVFHKFFFYL